MLTSNAQSESNQSRIDDAFRSEADQIDVCLRLGRIPLNLVREDPSLIAMPANGGIGTAYALFKRCIDFLSVIALGALLVAIFPAIALSIRLDSRGPVLYRQTRLGRNNRHFTIYKFRTMTHDAELAGAAYAVSNDPRVTRVGRFLRNTRIDELPQLWNILIGDMSLIGPRPERPEHLEMLEAAIPHFSTRTAIRPGLTGWAQVSGGYAATLEETCRKFEYDLYYLLFGSPRLDVRILIATARVVFGQGGR